jgi:hypothetical protein
MDEPISSGLITANDYYLEDVTIVTAVNNVNIKAMVIEISYYEDIFRGTVSGHVLISDSISMIDRLGLSGGDFLKLSFKKSKESPDSAMINRYFRIYRVSERVLNNAETENYTLNFCSEELLLSEQIKVSKSYTGKKISEIVNDILVNKMSIDPKSTSIQETSGIYDFVIPYKKPFEAINWLSIYASSDRAVGADFMFFENSNGFNFQSLQNMFDTQIYNYYIYSQRSVGDDPNILSKSLGRDIVGIKSYTFLDTFDSLYGTTTGAFANRVISIDPLTRQYRDTKFDYIDYFSKAKKLNNSPVINNLKNRLGKTQNQNYDSVLKVVVSNADQKKAKGVSEMPWAVANDIKIENYLPNRTAQIALSHYSRMKIVLAGDPNLTVGKTIFIELPSSYSKKDGSGLNEGNPDQYYTGKYLITAVRHIIGSALKYETIVEVVKDSHYLSPLSSYTDSKVLSDAIKGNT